MKWLKSVSSCFLDRPCMAMEKSHHMSHTSANMLKIYKSKKSFGKLFIAIQKDLKKILGDDCVIEHVGSTAIPGVDGKGIIDVLIGFDNQEQIINAADKLLRHGYFSARKRLEDQKDRVSMYSSGEDTTIGDVHLHMVLKDSADFINFIKVRDFLRQNPDEAKKYSELKYKIAKETGFSREEYKNQKSKFIEKILMKSKSTEYSRTLN